MARVGVMASRQCVYIQVGAGGEAGWSDCTGATQGKCSEFSFVSHYLSLAFIGSIFVYCMTMVRFCKGVCVRIEVVE